MDLHDYELWISINVTDLLISIIELWISMIELWISMIFTDNYGTP